MERGGIGPDGIFIPFPQGASGTILGTFVILGLGLLVLIVAVYWLGPLIEKSVNRALRSFDLESALPKPLAMFLGVLWTALFATFVLGMFWVMLRLALRSAAATAADPADLRWYLLTLTAMTAALGAVVALPFTLLRTAYNRRQTVIAEENLTTDLINKAVEGLGAEKTVSRLGRPVRIFTGPFQDRKFTFAPGEQIVLPDGARALDADGNVVPLSRGTAQQAGEIRVRQWTGQRTHIHWQDAPEQQPGDGEAVAGYGDWQTFNSTLPNIEVRTGAILALERLSQKTPSEHIRIMEILCAYLRENFRCDSPDPEIDPPDERTDAAAWHAYRRNLTAANARLRVKPRTDLATALEVLKRRKADREGNHDGDGKWQGYRLDLRGIDLRRFNLAGIALLRADLRQARTEGSSLDRADLRETIFAGVTTEGTNLLNARLDGARLIGYTINNTDFFGPPRRSIGVFGPTVLRGAGLSHCEFKRCNADLELTSKVFAEAFGDGSVILPEGLDAGKPPLEHWATEQLESNDFYREWRAFQKRIGYDAARQSA